METKQKVDSKATWTSKSLNEAESQLLAALSKTTPTWKIGQATFEEGPDLESTTFGFEQPEEEAQGVALIVRNKADGATAAKSATSKNKGTPMSAEEFRRLKSSVAEKLASDPIFGGTNNTP